MAAFVPPTFANIGKKVKDLFSKKYDFSNTVTAKNKTKAGVTLETTANLGAAITGGVKSKYEDKSFGEVETEINTVGKVAGSTKLTKLADGLTVTVNSDMDANKGGPLAGKVSAEYAADGFAATALVQTIPAGAVVETTGAIGYEGVTIAGLIKLELRSAKQEIKDYNVAAEYSQSDLTVSLKTEQSANVINLAYFHKVNSDSVIGAQLVYAPKSDKGPAQKLVFGTEYNLDKSTVVKAKADTTGEICAAVQHQLPNPRLQLGLAAKFQYTNGAPLQSKALGINLTFGDY